jgi:hypothetical protein
VFYLTRRQTRAAMSAAAGAAVYLAASELGKDKLKMTGLFVLASASMAGMVTAKASAKAYSAHKRIDTLVPIITSVSTSVGSKYDKSGGTISGSVTTTGIVNASGQSRADLNYSPDSQQGTAPGTYSQPYENGVNSRVNNLMNAMQNVSDRADWLKQQLAGGNIVIN